jgi:hypothetical protein
MTKKHFTAMAAEFKDLWSDACQYGDSGDVRGVRNSVEAFIRVAKQDNPKFDADRFRMACGGI